MAALTTLENKLDEMLGKKAPVQLPENAKKTIVQYLPWINLALAVLTLLSVRWLWVWAHAAIDYANSLSVALGGNKVAEVHRLGFVVWLGLIVLLIEGLLYLLAFPGTKARKKSGWDLLFYAALVNVVYGVVILFSDYGGVSQLLGSIIGSVIGLYFLFQIRSYYTGNKSAPKSDTPATPSAS